MFWTLLNCSGITKLYYILNPTVAEVYLTDPGWGSTGKVQVLRGEEELDLNFTCATSAGVARSSPPPTPLKSTKAKSRYNAAKPSCTWTWPRWTWAEVVRSTSEFTKVLQIILKYFRFYWSTSAFSEVLQNFTELLQIFTELLGVLEVQILVLLDPAEVYYWANRGGA